jgi:putative transposase
MPRISRALLVEEGSTNHCTWRSHGESFVLDSDEAKEEFLRLLGKYLDRYGIEIHSYCIMNTHPHVHCRSTLGQEAFSAFWKVVNQCFAVWSNRRTGGRGQVVRDRVRSPQVQDGDHQLQVMKYGDMNPVRAGLVDSPKDWRWSSYRFYAFGEPNPLVTPAPEYLALGRSAPARRSAYVHMFARRLIADHLQRRHDLVQGPFVGDDEWVAARLAALAIRPAPD